MLPFKLCEITHRAYNISRLVRSFPPSKFNLVMRNSSLFVIKLKSVSVDTFLSVFRHKRPSILWGNSIAIQVSRIIQWMMLVLLLLPHSWNHLNYFVIVVVLVCCFLQVTGIDLCMSLLACRDLVSIWVDSSKLISVSLCLPLSLHVPSILGNNALSSQYFPSVCFPFPIVV
jgi:hypothetical protein